MNTDRTIHTILRSHLIAGVLGLLAVAGCDQTPDDTEAPAPMQSGGAGKADAVDDPCGGTPELDACLEQSCGWLVRAPESGGDVCVLPDAPLPDVDSECLVLETAEFCAEAGCEWLIRTEEDGGDLCVPPTAEPDPNALCSMFDNEEDCGDFDCQWFPRAEENGGDVCVAVAEPTDEECNINEDEEDCLTVPGCDWMIRAEANGGDICVPV